MAKEAVFGVRILRIEDLKVFRDTSKSNGLAAVFSARMDDGQYVTMGLETQALEELCKALIENSPRTPGTPGRN